MLLHPSAKIALRLAGLNSATFSLLSASEAVNPFPARRPLKLLHQGASSEAATVETYHYVLPVISLLNCCATTHLR